MKTARWQDWVTRPKKKPMPMSQFIPLINKLYGNDVEPHTESDDPRYLSPEDKKDILQSIPVSPLVKKKDKKAPKKVSTNPRYVWNIAKGELEDHNKDIREIVGDIYDVTKQKKLVAEKPSKPSKPTYLNGNVIDITPLIDDQWWKILDYPLIPEEPKDEVRRRYERLKQLQKEREAVEGLAALLHLLPRRI